MLVDICKNAYNVMANESAASELSYQHEQDTARE